MKLYVLQQTYIQSVYHLYMYYSPLLYADIILRLA